MAGESTGRSLVTLGKRSVATLKSFGEKVAAIIVPSSVDSLTPYEDFEGLGPRAAPFHVAFEVNAERVIDQSEQILDARGVKETEPVTLGLGKAILESAGEEDRPELVGLWARLLASARDPNRRGQVRKEFTRVLREMDPIDAVVFELIDGTTYQPSLRAYIASRLGEEELSVELSLAHLIELGLVRNKSSAGPESTFFVADAIISPLGALLRKALR